MVATERVAVATAGADWVAGKMVEKKVAEMEEQTVALEGARASGSR